MPRYKARRHYRYQSLRYLGFYDFEASDLSRVPFKVPYMNALIKDRERLVARAKRLKWSDDKLRDHVRKMYVKRGWVRTTRRDKKKWDAFRMMKHFERKYKDTHPQYESPGTKKRKDFVRYRSKLEKSFKLAPIKLPGQDEFQRKHRLG